MTALSSETTSRPHLLAVSEIFGPTIQGEGPAVGQPAVFLRLAGCHVGCDWCDTRYSWDYANPTDGGVQQHEAAELAATLANIGTTEHLLVVTGGEPLLQQRALLSVLTQPALAGRRVHLETSGTVVPLSSLLDLFELAVISPKLAHSRVNLERRINSEALAAFGARDYSWFKFVVTGLNDFEEVASIVREHNLSQVMVMAEGTKARDIQERSRAIAGPAAERGWGVSPRWHLDLWGNDRGH
jgi:7-cyano-7-deazaguanosine (preQ0) biosynthesis protein QueE